ncbi:MAG TPA: glycosyltransferase [Patescibacteria group bacterium]|nr:glycosyltransferase [Patescibacteria group bacterium]
MLTGPKIRNRGADLVRSLASRLSSPRDEALITAAQASYALVTGHKLKAGFSARREPRVNGRALRRAQAAIDAGDAARAIASVDELYREYPQSVRVLRLRRDVLKRTGDLHGQAAMLHQIHRLDDTPQTRLSERRAIGRLNELTPGWLPRIPGRQPVTPDGDDVILHLNKESSPYLTTGFTMRSRYNLIAARDAGLRPVIVTALGFPRLLGITSFPAVEIVDDMPHYRLDLGPNYPLDRPLDQILEDQAWLTARVARQVRPAIIHASSGHRGFEHALVGLALREHIDRPLVYEVRSVFESSWGHDDESWAEASDHYSLRFDTETRTMRAADHVLVISEVMRDELIERGVDPARLTVFPNAIDPEVFSPRPPDPALQARYGIDGHFTFGYVSLIDHPREDHELLMDATKELRRRGRRVRCLIIGDGKRRAELEEYAKRTGVANDVVFTGHVPHDEVASHYALLDFFVVPRRDERAARMVTPLKPYEALAMARPLVIADLPPLREIARPEERGLAYTPGDMAGLASVLERLMDDPALGQRIAAQGHEWVVRERTWAANGAILRDVYRGVLERWAARRPAA